MKDTESQDQHAQERYPQLILFLISPQKQYCGSSMKAPT